MFIAHGFVLLWIEGFEFHEAYHIFIVMDNIHFYFGKLGLNVNDWCYLFVYLTIFCLNSVSVACIKSCSRFGTFQYEEVVHNLSLLFQSY